MWCGRGIFLDVTGSCGAQFGMLAAFSGLRAIFRVGRWGGVLFYEGIPLKKGVESLGVKGLVTTLFPLGYAPHVGLTPHHSPIT
jgi:hypothetical protein